MLSHLPLEILIIIINYLEFQDIINLIRTKNKNIFFAIQYYENIVLRLSGRKNKLYNYFPIFHSPKILDIQDGVVCKNNILKIASKKEWQIEKIIFNNARTLKNENMTEFFKCNNKLKHLILYNCIEFTGEHISLINRNLETLKVRYNYLTFPQLEILNEFKYLKDLDLSYGQILFNQGIERLELINLEKLNLTNVVLNFNQTFNNFLKKIKNLKELHLDFNPFTNQMIYDVNKNAPNLEVFTYSNSITHYQEFNLVNNWNNLHTIDFSFNVFNDEMLMSIVDKAPNLNNINLDLTNISDISIIYMVLKLNNIKKLNIARNRVSNHAVNNIAYHCHNLKELDISGTHVTTDAINRVIENNNLNYLTIMNCICIKKRFLKKVKVMII